LRCEICTRAPLARPTRSVAHVRRVDAPFVGRHACELDDLGRLGIRARHVLQARREPHRAVDHRLEDERLHAIELVQRRRSPRAAHHRRAHRVVADERRVIHRHARLADLRERLADVDRRPAAIARDNRRHAHPDEVRRRGMIRDIVRVRVHVDEAGRDDEAAGVDALRGLRAGQVANRGDAPVANADVGDARRRARAVDHAAAGQDHVERAPRLRRGPGQRERQKCCGELHSTTLGVSGMT
jgi:hypothetical protein